jgi:hypothetical protein
LSVLLATPLPPHDSHPPDGTWDVTLNACYLTERGLAALPDYSCSLPTGVTIGKVWKRRIDYYDESKGWYLGTYEDINDPERVGIRWRPICVLTPRQMQVRFALREVEMRAMMQRMRSLAATGP